MLSWVGENELKQAFDIRNVCKSFFASDEVACAKAGLTVQTHVDGTTSFVWYTYDSQIDEYESHSEVYYEHVYLNEFLVTKHPNGDFSFDKGSGLYYEFGGFLYDERDLQMHANNPRKWHKGRASEITVEEAMYLVIPTGSEFCLMGDRIPWKKINVE